MAIKINPASTLIRARRILRRRGGRGTGGGRRMCPVGLLGREQAVGKAPSWAPLLGVPNLSENDNLGRFSSTRAPSQSGKSISAGVRRPALPNVKVPQAFPAAIAIFTRRALQEPLQTAPSIQEYASAGAAFRETLSDDEGVASLCDGVLGALGRRFAVYRKGSHVAEPHSSDIHWHVLGKWRHR